MSIVFSAAIDGFLKSCERTHEPSTILHHRKRLNSFRKAFSDRCVLTVTSDEILQHLDRVAVWPDGREKAPDTLRTSIVSWEQLQKWLVKSGYIPRRITDPIPKPTGRKREALPTPDETRAIIQHARKDFIPLYRSLRLTGARPGELSSAKISDIDNVIGEIVLHRHKTARKTGKPRRIAIGHESLVEILSKELSGRTEGYIFLKSNGKPWTVPDASKAFREARDAAGLRKELVLYLTRHEHGNTLYQITQDIKCVADALGHSQLSTTMRYTRVDADTLKKNQRKFVENLN